MITSITEDTDFSIREMSRGDVSAIDLNNEMDDMDAEGVDYDLYEVIFREGTDHVSGTLLWVPGADRAGLCVNGPSDWFDADSPKDAIEVWRSGEWTDYR